MEIRNKSTNPHEVSLFEEIKKSNNDDKLKIIQGIGTFYNEVVNFDLRTLRLQNWENLKIYDITKRNQILSNNITCFIYTANYINQKNKKIKVIVKIHLSEIIENLKKYEEEAKILANAYKLDKNSFLKIYGGFYDIVKNKHRFNLVMEYHDKIITEDIDTKMMKLLKPTNKDELEVMKFLFEKFNACNTLVNSLKILHIGITPSRIFKVTKGSEVLYKLGSFEVDIFDQWLNRSEQEKCDNDLYGVCLAPEILNNLQSSSYESDGNFLINQEKLLESLTKDPGLADIFSLGIIAYQMAIKEPIFQLSACKQSEIIKNIKKIKGWDWLGPILKDMTRLDSKKRMNFQDLIEKYKIPDSYELSLIAGQFKILNCNISELFPYNCIICNDYYFYNTSQNEKYPIKFKMVKTIIENGKLYLLEFFRDSNYFPSIGLSGHWESIAYFLHLTLKHSEHEMFKILIEHYFTYQAYADENLYKKIIKMIKNERYYHISELENWLVDYINHHRKYFYLSNLFGCSSYDFIKLYITKDDQKSEEVVLDKNHWVYPCICRAAIRDDEKLIWLCIDYRLVPKDRKKVLRWLAEEEVEVLDRLIRRYEIIAAAFVMFWKYGNKIKKNLQREILSYF